MQPGPGCLHGHRPESAVVVLTDGWYVAVDGWRARARFDDELAQWQRQGGEVLHQPVHDRS
jgi:hypothetical protein